MTIDIKRLTADLDYWDEVAPEGAEWYAPDEPMHNEGWYKKVERGHEFSLSRQCAWVTAHSFNRRTLIPRPAPSLDGEWWPPVGVEFQFSLNGFNWEDRVMLFNDGITCLMAHKKYPANRWHYKCDDPDILCRPLKTEKERVVEAAMKIGGLRARDGAKEVYGALYDAGMLKKMPGAHQ